MSGLMRPDDIVPFAMKPIRLKLDSLHFFLADFASGWIFAAVQCACSLQSFGCCGLGCEMDAGFVVSQLLATRIRRAGGITTVCVPDPVTPPAEEMTGPS